MFADIGEAATYCPECAEREFGDGTTGGKASYDAPAGAAKRTALDPTADRDPIDNTPRPATTARQGGLF